MAGSMLGSATARTSLAVIVVLALNLLAAPVQAFFGGPSEYNTLRPLTPAAALGALVGLFMLLALVGLWCFGCWCGCIANRKARQRAKREQAESESIIKVKV
mmetsp:Transcript_8017/g.33752  ORF Transcript_8017/g.33752 Transcript_8017/m.33752 type:complete len:102 (+) Transcript_8017:81-386(+)